MKHRFTGRIEVNKQVVYQRVSGWVEIEIAARKWSGRFMIESGEEPQPFDRADLIPDRGPPVLLKSLEIETEAEDGKVTGIVFEGDGPPPRVDP
jgi:hypothetical protein